MITVHDMMQVLHRACADLLNLVRLNEATDGIEVIVNNTSPMWDISTNEETPCPGQIQRLLMEGAIQILHHSSLDIGVEGYMPRPLYSYGGTMKPQNRYKQLNRLRSRLTIKPMRQLKLILLASPLRWGICQHFVWEISGQLRP